jgi:choline dehydrogenase-like flavoprotein
MTQPSLNWGYKTQPQTQLKGQQIDYSRGKGLGGSSAINFSCWTVGSQDDFEKWAGLVKDEAWEWKNVKERLKRIESYHREVPDGCEKWVNVKESGTVLCSEVCKISANHRSEQIMERMVRCI